MLGVKRRSKEGCHGIVAQNKKALLPQHLNSPTYQITQLPDFYASLIPSIKAFNFLDLDGWRSLRSALASIWRIRSRVTAKDWPTSSRVCSEPSSRPKRILMTFSSRGVSVRRTC